MEIKSPFKFNFLLELLNNLEMSKNEFEIMNAVKKIFSDYFEENSLKIVDVQVFLYNKVLDCVCDFTKPWQKVDSKLEKKANEYFLFFKNNRNLNNTHTPKFILNDYKIIASSGITDLNKEFKKNIKQNDTNLLSVSLSSMEKPFGILNIEFKILSGEIKFNKTFPEVIYLASSQVANAIKTLDYVKKMEKNIKFYQTMKDVAKIIETQYELAYILPILGEMIDKFISQHLIYIFLKNPRKNEYTLVWPSKCTNSNVIKILNNTMSLTTIVEENGKMGIFPLACEGKAIGAIVAYNHFEPLTQSEIEYLEQLSTQASLTVDRATSYSKILKYATLDALTGLNNRHQFEHRLKQEVATAKRQSSDLCCIMLDIDFFKSVNDTYGHAVGDCVLKNVSKTIKKVIREYDIASRYGGEEFTILTPNTSLDEAYLVAQRLRSEIEKKKINIEEYRIEDVKEISVTISVGVAQYEKKKSDPSSLYQDADKALYEAKERGRNRVVTYSNDIENKKS